MARKLPVGSRVYVSDLVNAAVGLIEKLIRQEIDVNEFIRLAGELPESEQNSLCRLLLGLLGNAPHRTDDDESS